MRLSILPKTSLGRWSVGLAAAFILLFAVYVVLLLLGVLDIDRVRLIPLIAAATFGISGIAAFVTGLISVIKSKERSILVFLAVVVGLFDLAFLFLMNA